MFHKNSFLFLRLRSKNNMFVWFEYSSFFLFCYIILLFRLAPELGLYYSYQSILKSNSSFNFEIAGFMFSSKLYFSVVV